MVFLKRQFPLLICFVVGVVTAMQYYVPSHFSQKVAEELSNWYIIVAMFAALLGFVSVSMVHSRKIRKREPGWAYSTLVFLGILSMVAVGFVAGGKESTSRPPDEVAASKSVSEEKDAQGNVTRKTETWLREDGTKVIVIETTQSPEGRLTSAKETKFDPQGRVVEVREREIDDAGSLVAVEGTQTAFGWLYDNTLVPLQGTMFALLGFYVASAAFRSFRAKSLDSAVLLIAAILVMLGNVSFTNHLWANVLGVHDIAAVRFEMPDLVGWIMSTPNAAARRGVGFGVALGVIATSLKIIFGIERAYLGGGD